MSAGKQRDQKCEAPPKILPLPKEVVNRIAAGEVVQRPASIAKELIENSLDAESSTIEIISNNGGLSLLTVTDNGYGIHPRDLQLAATRFATSKLTHFEDLKKIQTFGFRGEALASASMVSKLTITSRRRTNMITNNDKTFSKACAYRQNYKDGKPSSSAPKPTAGNMGTVIKIQDLFYNVPNRKRAFHGKKKESEEYNKILNVAIRYSIHCAGDGIAFTCRKKAGQTDLNTQYLPSIKKIITAKKKNAEMNDFKVDEEEKITATKEVISHLFGSNVARELLIFKKQLGDIKKESMKCFSQEHNASNGQNDPLFTYSAKGLFTNPSFSPPRAASTFILFINHRLVEFGSLKRALESIYAETLTKGAKPFIYLDLELPGWHIDVNVHPTKRELAYLFEDELIKDLSDEVKEVLGGASGSKVFQAKSLLPIGRNVKIMEKRNTFTLSQPKQAIKEKSIKLTETDDSSYSSGEDIDQDITPSRKRRISPISPSLNKRKTVDVRKLVRTNTAAPAGALEPFLVSTQTQSSTSRSTLKVQKEPTKLMENFQQSISPLSSQEEEKRLLESSKINVQHEISCPRYGKSNEIDLSLPGAFAMICSCQVKNPTERIDKPHSPQNKVVRPKKVQPSNCELTSIHDMRSKITFQSHSQLTEKLRESTFVGIVSRQWSLIQWGVELLMINHNILSKLLFYQLTIWRFGEIEKATFPHPLCVKDLIESVFSSDDDSSPKISCTERETSDAISKRATQCLSSNSKMLDEYFSVEFENHEGELFLTGLPILLDNHSPQPSGLPQFLLRLATQVNWKEEEKCFEGLCREIGNYYAEIPMKLSKNATDGGNFNDRTAETFVKHTIFPALNYLLVPSQDVAVDGSVIKLAVLPSLYKIFERC